MNFPNFRLIQIFREDQLVFLIWFLFFGFVKSQGEPGKLLPGTELIPGPAGPRKISNSCNLFKSKQDLNSIFYFKLEIWSNF